MTADEPDAEPRSRLQPVLRDGTKVRFLELFFDLVFVLAFTQCTTLMIEQPTWEGLGRGLLVLAVLWWAWGAYAWLTSVLDPEEGPARIAMFGAMAAVLVAALAVPGAFGDDGLTFALAYGIVRAAHLALFVLASQDDPALRHQVGTLAVSTVISVALLTGAYFVDGAAQGGLWATAVVIDFVGPALFGARGWKLVPAHFAERHGLIIILALGESIVVLGVGADAGLGAGVIVAAGLGVALASALWWIYFDVVSIITEQRMTQAPEGPERNAMARDSYSYLHFPMAAGIVLVAVGLEITLAHVDDALHAEAAFALLGGVAIYLLAHVGLRLRNARTIGWRRLLMALALLALVPVATQVTSLATLAALNVALWTMVAFETRSYGTARLRLRRG